MSPERTQTERDEALKKVREIGDFLRDLRRLNDGDPDVDRDDLMARKRSLIESLEPGFHDRLESRTDS